MKITIINSKKHWRNGWLSSQAELQIVVDILKKADIEVHITEVDSVASLENVLQNVSDNTLVWSNAYYVNTKENEVVWLNDYVQKYQLPLLGSGATTLRNLLQKDITQQMLRTAHIPIPNNLVMNATQINEIELLLAQSNLEFPVVLKPTAESGSVGVVMANDVEDASQKAKQILHNYPHSQVIVEPFLPSDDITCGFLQLGDQTLLLPTYYLVKSKAGTHHILSRTERLSPWDGKDKMQPVITDEQIRTQLTVQVPRIIEAFDIQDISRVDGRLDKTGTLRFFDVNGLPALCFPEGVMVKQCLNSFPNYEEKVVFEALIHTVVNNALQRYGFSVPPIMQEHNLFTLQSDLVITLQKIASDISLADSL
ncbi:MAG TPA: hypothetical protein DCS93_35230 [Microscillaceae bacterium]|nr:hypothetical protein [Microscillaceae bacterium]